MKLTMNSVLKKVILAGAMVLLLGGCQAADSQRDTSKPPDYRPPVKQTGPQTPAASNTEDAAHRKLIQDIMQAASEGKVPDCEFGAKTAILEKITQKWGEPDQSDYVAAAKGTYITYQKHHMVFGFNKGAQIFEVRSFASNLQALKRSEVEQVLGKPEHVQTYQGQEISGYTAGDDFKLLFVFAPASQSNPDPSVDHVNVLYPAGTVNSMAGDPGREW